MDIQALKTIWSATLTEADFESGDPEATRRGVSVAETFGAGATIGGEAGGEATYSSGATLGSVAPGSPASAPAGDRSLVNSAVTGLGLPSGFDDGDEVARGGMGVVLRARQRSLEREIAIKRSLSRSPAARGAFVGEALTTAYLDHPNIVPVHQLEESAGQLSLAMKLVGGREWKALLRTEEKPGLDANLSILLKVCDAVAFAHSKGVAHCDLKPENVMVGAFNEVLVMDWGVAVDIGGAARDGVTRARPRESLTGPFGTPSYMAPEMARGEGASIDARTDVYLLGAILFELLTGRPPHREKTLLKTLVKASSGAAPALPSDKPEELAAICARAMAGDKGARFASVKDFQGALEAFLGHRESLTIAGEAERTLAEARRTLSAAGGLSDRRRIALYARFADAVAGFRQARSLWAENPRALIGEREAHQEYAEAALAGDDLGLAEAQAQGLDQEGVKKRLLDRIAARKDEKARAARSARRMRRSVIGLVTTVVLGLSGGLYLINEKQKETEAERLRAVSAEKAARDEKALAQAAERRAREEQARAKAAEAGEREERLKAEKRLTVLKSTFNTMINSLSDVLGVAPSAEAQKTQRRIVAQILEDVEALRAEGDSDDQVLAFFNADALYELGDACRKLKDYEKSFAYLARGRSLIERSLKTAPADRALRLRLADFMLSERLTAFQLRDLKRTLPLSTRVLADVRALVEEQPGDLAAREMLALALSAHASDKKDSGEPAAAVALYGENLELSRELLKVKPRSEKALYCLALTAYQCGGISAAQKKPAQARAFFAETLQAGRALVEIQGPATMGHRLLIMALGQLGDLAFAEGKNDEAYQLYTEARERSDRMASLDFANDDLRKNMIRALDIMGRSFQRRGRTDLALGALRSNLEANRSLLALAPRDPKRIDATRKILDKIGELHASKKRHEEALDAFKESLVLLDRRVAADPEDAFNDDRYRLIHRRMGMSYDALALPIQAGEAFEKAIAVCRRVYQRDSKSKRGRRGLALALIRDGSFRLRQRQMKAARASIEEAEALSRGLARDFASDTALILDHAYALRRMAELEEQEGSLDRARDRFAEALVLRRRRVKFEPKNGSARRDLSITLENLARVAARQGRAKEAAALYRESLLEERAAGALTRPYPRAEARLKKLAEEQEAKAGEG